MTDFEVHKVGTSDEIERLRAMTAASMGVGDGNGQLFVHGDYASIKAAQEIVFRMERAEAERDALRADAERYRWLRDATNWSETGPCPVVATCEDTIFGEALDIAIDVAMQHKEQSK